MIKDTPFDINALKAKRRYEINKGKKNFDVKRIRPSEHRDELYEVLMAAYQGWPEKYRPTVNEEKFKNSINSWGDLIVYGGFDKVEGKLCAFSYLKEYPNYLEFSVLRARPDSERSGINATMVVAILEDYNERLGKAFYINDGERAIRHETAFQDYLEKYFGFRKAYCRLNIQYQWWVKAIVKTIWPFRKIFVANNKIGSIISSVMKMEECCKNKQN